MIPVKLDLGSVIKYITLEEYLKNRQHYDNLQLEATGQCATKDIPYIELDKEYCVCVK